MPRESKAKLGKRTAKIVAGLKRRYPDARCSLDYGGPLELLVATILSAQCTDVRVNIVTAELFAQYKTAADYAAATQAKFEQQIRSTGFFRNKAKNIRASAASIVENFGGEVPDKMADLLSLPGVARKTANVVLGTAFGICDGVVVDTHVMRISQRLKLTRRKNNQGDKMEQDLQALVARKDWTIFSHLMIFHGRACCSARKPDCGNCPVGELCPSAFKV